MINFSDIPKIIYNRWNRFRLKRCGVKLSGYSCFLGRIYINISTESDVQIFNNVVFTNGRGANPLCGNINGAIQVSRNATLIVGSYTGISSEGVAELPLLKLLRIEYFEPNYDFSVLIRIFNSWRLKSRQI